MIIAGRNHRLLTKNYRIVVQGSVKFFAVFASTVTACLKCDISATVLLLAQEVRPHNEVALYVGFRAGSRIRGFLVFLYLLTTLAYKIYILQHYGTVCLDTFSTANVRWRLPLNRAQASWPVSWGGPGGRR